MIWHISLKLSCLAHSFSKKHYTETQVRTWIICTLIYTKLLASKRYIYIRFHWCPICSFVHQLYYITKINVPSVEITVSSCMVLLWQNSCRGWNFHGRYTWDRSCWVLRVEIKLIHLYWFRVRKIIGSTTTVYWMLNFE